MSSSQDREATPGVGGGFAHCPFSDGGGSGWKAAFKWNFGPAAPAFVD